MLFVPQNVCVADIITGQTAQVTGMRTRLGELGADLPEDAACNDLNEIYGADGMIPYLPRIEDDGVNTYRRTHLELFI